MELVKRSPEDEQRYIHIASLRMLQDWVREDPRHRKMTSFTSRDAVTGAVSTWWYAGATINDYTVKAEITGDNLTPGLVESLKLAIANKFFEKFNGPAAIQ
jgi:hypothetical protein